MGVSEESDEQEKSSDAQSAAARDMGRTYSFFIACFLGLLKFSVTILFVPIYKDL